MHAMREGSSKGESDLLRGMSEGQEAEGDPEEERGMKAAIPEENILRLSVRGASVPHAVVYSWRKSRSWKRRSLSRSGDSWTHTLNASESFG